MPNTPYRSIDYIPNNTITQDSMNQLVFNYQWILENSPKARYYNTLNNPVESNTILVAGRARFPKQPKKSSATVSVKFGVAFAPPCRPHVTTGIVATKQYKVFATINGPGTELHPTSTGFDINLEIDDPSNKKNNISEEFWVNWHAFGYRLDEGIGNV